MNIQELINELVVLRNEFGEDAEVTLARGITDALSDPNNQAEISEVEPVADSEGKFLFITIY